MESPHKFPRIGVRRDFCLQDQARARKTWQGQAQLAFRRAVAVGRFDMADAQFQGPLDRGLQIGLVLCRHFFQRYVLPLVLVTHPTAAEDGHIEFGTAKTSSDHASQYNEQGHAATTGSLSGGHLLTG